MFGFLNINKPLRMTSRDVVNVVQRWVRPERIGHAGTLDPLATGVLVIGIGYGTRLFPYLQLLPKSYRATFRLGVRSETDDLEGPLEEVPVEQLPRERVEEALARWRGEVQQVPPAYSAAKVAGRRAYELARQGRSFELQPRSVTIHRLEITSFAFPDFTVDVECSSGTYIRSLGRDIAGDLGTSAVMTELSRTSIGPFCLYDAIPLERISADSLPQQLLSPLLALPMLPQVGLAAAQTQDVLHGRTIELAEVNVAADEIAALDWQGQLIAILRRAADNRWQPDRCFRR